MSPIVKLPYPIGALLENGEQVALLAFVGPTEHWQAVNQQGQQLLVSSESFAELQDMDDWIGDLLFSLPWRRRNIHKEYERNVEKGIIEEMLDAIRTGRTNDDRIAWQGDDQVTLRTFKASPMKSGQCLTWRGWRKRLREGVAEVLLKEGWERLGNDCFRQRSKLTVR